MGNEFAEPFIVQKAIGYNSWPMIQAIGEKLVCVYSRGSGHTIWDKARAVYARTSIDKGRTWTAETLVSDTPGYGDVAVGKGLDAAGAMLLWVRCVGPSWHHDLYRTTDGVSFTFLTTPTLAVSPVQITDVFAVPAGLMALWFAGGYDDDGPSHSWGKMTSSDGGLTWEQTVIESALTKADWPTEPSAVYLGDGRILVIARAELIRGTSPRVQFQMISSDNGATWARAKTNIDDVLISTPSLILDAESGLLSNYYYQRGPGGVLRRRVVDPESVFSAPLRWPPSEVVTRGSEAMIDAGNVNATVIGRTHYLSYYSGKDPDTAVLVIELPAPIEDETNAHRKNRHR